jgi:hypothetical protein
MLWIPNIDVGPYICVVSAVDVIEMVPPIPISVGDPLTLLKQ